MSEYEDLGMLANKGNARISYDTQCILNWSENSSRLLNGTANKTPADGEPKNPIDDDGWDIPLPD